MKLTPMMQQWQDCKQSAKEALLFFHMGDFYELFHEDAEVAAREIELTLTKRGGTPMAGVPWHTCDTYVDRLVAKGFSVAIAEQVEDPKQAKGLVRREIVRIVTPGTVVSSSLISEKSNNYIACFAQVGSLFGLAYLDVTTGEFCVAEFEEERSLVHFVARIAPAEMVVAKKCKVGFEVPRITVQEDWLFDHQIAYSYLKEHFGVSHLDGFGLKGKIAAINAAGALLAYIHDELCLSIDHIRRLQPVVSSGYMQLDTTAMRTLDLVGENSLLEVIDETLTPMGGRLLRKFLMQPLLDVEKIEKRQDAVEEFVTHPKWRLQTRDELKGVRDLERLLMKISSKSASPKELVALRDSLAKLPAIEEASRKPMEDLAELCTHLQHAVTDEPPLRVGEGRVIREGYNEELDELRALTRDGKEWLTSYQEKIKAELGIKNLKVSFNRVFGYYIEVSRGQAHLMDDSFVRRQTLANSERFISPILKEYEEKVLTAEEKILAIESRLFAELFETILEKRDAIVRCAGTLAHLDCVTSLAQVAVANRYCRPRVDASDVLQITEGRHSIVEEVVRRENFIGNETHLNADERLMLITGPNMAGKSTYIRQVALIVILAQMGSFVPATSAHVGIVDKIFTRIGASDDLSRGQSTFMVEMSETANILHNVTSRSLVILDEIGRGTSTYDGVSIAWAVAEYLLTDEKRRAKTLFATHYWELTELEATTAGAINYHASVQESEGQVLFLHKIARGGATRSYGIHVAKLAGLPTPVIARAKTLLEKLENKRPKTKPLLQETQLTFF